jgi:tetratricopeptide (TPR) repeat protein
LRPLRLLWLAGTLHASIVHAQDPITFNKDIAPIISAHCTSCHRPGGGAPFSLFTYDDVRQRAALIARLTAARAMPPWKPVAGFGRFAGERRLTGAEIELIDRWAASGAPEGDAPASRGAQRAALPAAADGWLLGTPDLVVTLPDAYQLAASGPDVFRTFVTAIPIAGSRYVKGIEFQPGVSRVMHHASIKVDSTPSSRRLDDDEPGPGYDGGGGRTSRFPNGQFLAWTPGQVASMLPDGMAWELEPSTDLVLELHMVPDGKPERVQPSVAFYFSDRPPTRLSYIVRLGSQTIDIPAGESGFLVTDTFELPVSADVSALQPHAHLLGKTVKVFARLPDGTVEGLLYIDDWDFRWQEVYRLREGLVLPKGTVLVMEYTYDNSGNNPRNPHRPPRRVTYGQTTASEMGNVWIQLVPASGDDLALLDRSYAPKLLRDDIAGYEKSSSLSPSDVRLRTELAFLYVEAGQLNEAVRELNAAIALAPKSAAPHFALGTILLTQRKLGAAREQFTDTLRLNPAFAEAHVNLGVVDFAEGRMQSAVASNLEALRLDPRNVQARYNLGRARAALGDVDAAIEDYRGALELRPQDLDVMTSLASALGSKGLIDAAVALYRRVLAINPDVPAALVDLAWILATTDRPGLRAPEEAVRLAERVADLTNRRNATVLDTLAMAYFAAGRTADAIAAATVALGQALNSGQEEQANRTRAHLALFQRQ